MFKLPDFVPVNLFKPKQEPASKYKVLDMNQYFVVVVISNIVFVEGAFIDYELAVQNAEKRNKYVYVGAVVITKAQLEAYKNETE